MVIPRAAGVTFSTYLIKIKRRGALLVNGVAVKIFKFKSAWILLFLTSCSCFHSEQGVLMNEISTFNDVQVLFANNVAHVQKIIAQMKSFGPEQVCAIVRIPDDQRTFANTAQAMDEIGRRVSIGLSVLGLLKEVSPDESIRTQAHDGLLLLQPFLQENLSKNVSLFKAFKAYVDGNARTDALNAQEKYYLQETMRAYAREGLLLPEPELKKVKELSTQLSQIGLQFEKNITDVTTKLPLSAQQLVGVPEPVLAGLQKDDKGNYLVGLDYATVFPIMTHARDEKTRKAVFEAFDNRAYPQNYPLLKQLIAQRDELAHLLGFPTYAAYDLDDQMAKTPKIVEEFLNKIVAPARQKQAHEFKELTADLPATVTLTVDAQEQYKQKHFKLNDAEIAQYFPVAHVIEQILAIYQEFLGLTFEPLPAGGLWHESVQAFAVRNADDHVFRGYLLLDLYPRPHKYSHACMVDLVPPQRMHDGSLRSAVIAVIANFPTPTRAHPGLLRFTEVETFFHEFGHAMHGILGATQMSGFAGTSTKKDFVEVPSQMFEQWLKDPAIVRRLSCHYQTHEPLPDRLIGVLIKIDKFDIGDFTLRQLGIAQLSLKFFTGIPEDIQCLYQDITIRARPYIFFDSEKSHMPASFGHLIEYAAKYYSYLWSKVYALDLFAKIKRDGLLNPTVGKVLIEKVLGRGGSAQPIELVRDFLGREPNADAYIQYMQK